MPATPVDDLAPYVSLVQRWLTRAARENPLISSVDRDPSPDIVRWYVRMRGEEKAVTTVWLTLRDITLAYETYFMPAPEERQRECFEYLLRVNARLYGMRFAIGAEDAVYLCGQMPVHALDDDELDRILGSAYLYSEEHFRPAMRIGYGSRFRG